MRIFGFLLLFFISLPAFAETPDEVIALRARAESGDASAQYLMGSRYALGRGVPKDAKESVNWWRKAAEQGHVKAQVAFCSPLEGITAEDAFPYCLRAASNKDDPEAAWTAQKSVADAYEKGKGVKQDFSAAAKWWKTLADKDGAEAQIRLGKLYAQGKGVERLDSEAHRLFTAAAERGVAEAQVELGKLHAAGRGTSRDFDKAYFWFMLASKAQDERTATDARVQAELIEEQLYRDDRKKIAAQAAAWKPDFLGRQLKRMKVRDYVAVALVLLSGALPLAVLARVSRRAWFTRYPKMIVTAFALMAPLFSVLVRSASWRDVDAFFAAVNANSMYAGQALALSYLMLPGFCMFFFIPAATRARRIAWASAFGIIYLTIMTPVTVAFSLTAYCHFNPQCKTL